MENEIKIRLGIDAIDEQKFKLCDTLPDEIGADKLTLRYLIETEILRNEQKVNVLAGVHYAVEDDSLCELIVGTTFNLNPFSEIVSIDESKRTVSLKPNIIQTLLSVALGVLRGVLHEKVKGTALEAFPLPLVSTSALTEMNRFRIG